jgi:TusA-related sulfurtransferase
MSVHQLDTLGMKSPKPVLELALMAPQMKEGDILEIVGDSPTFKKDVCTWCERLDRVVLKIEDAGKVSTIRIQF